MISSKFISAICMCLVITGCSAFAPSRSTSHGTRVSPLNAYVPDGLTAEQYKQIRAKEEQQFKNKNLGRLGPRGFKSRSMEAWQIAYEKGQAKHSIAPFGYKNMLKTGELKPQDVPYMVRGGSWDNSDVKGVKRLPWLRKDKEYANGGYKKEQSVSFLGSGLGLDWTGTQKRSETAKIAPGFLS